MPPRLRQRAHMRRDGDAMSAYFAISRVTRAKRPTIRALPRHSARFDGAMSDEIAFAFEGEGLLYHRSRYFIRRKMPMSRKMPVSLIPQGPADKLSFGAPPVDGDATRDLRFRPVPGRELRRAYTGMPYAGAGRFRATRFRRAEAEGAAAAAARAIDIAIF